MNSKKRLVLLLLCTSASAFAMQCRRPAPPRGEIPLFSVPTPSTSSQPAAPVRSWDCTVSSDEEPDRVPLNRDSTSSAPAYSQSQKGWDSPVGSDGEPEGFGGAASDSEPNPLASGEDTPFYPTTSVTAATSAGVAESTGTPVPRPFTVRCPARLLVLMAAAIGIVSLCEWIKGYETKLRKPATRRS